MHYKNGRVANNGDKVVWIPNPTYGAVPIVGILQNATAGNDYCNGMLIPITPNAPTPNLKECLHFDDFMMALAAGESAVTPAPCPACAGQNVPHTTNCTRPADISTGTST